MLGTVIEATRCGDGTELRLATGAGAHTIHVPVRADHRAAARVEQVLRRCISLQVDTTDHTWSCVVRGVGHRRPVDLPVSTTTALGLIERGLPTVVRCS